MSAAFSMGQSPKTLGVRADFGSKGQLSGNLMLPAVQRGRDGTSNTFLTGEALSKIWGDPHVLKSGFGLLLPASARSKFQTGLLLPAFQLMPHIEQDNLHALPGPTKGLKVEGAKVTQVTPSGDGIAIWFQPQGIIAILIG